MRVAIVVPNRDGRRWLPGLVASIRAQTRAPDLLVVVDDGSGDDSVAWLQQQDVEVVVRAASGGFAVAANAGLSAVGEAEAGIEAVALVNADVELAPDWLARMVAALEADPAAAAVAGKMMRMDPPQVIDDAGDALRRDGVCEQRGAGRPDTGAFDVPGEVWGACAGAALYRRSAVVAVGGFDERLGMYLEDVDLALRLRLAGWTCRYEPAVARHAGGSSGEPVGYWVARNTLLLVARWFPWRWAPYVAYRQVSWLVHAVRGGGLAEHLRGLVAATPHLPACWRERRGTESGRSAAVSIERAIPWRPWHGPAAGGHPRSAR